MKEEGHLPNVRAKTIWGDFEPHFDQELGRGGAGVVYRARQISLDRWVALKVLSPRGESDPKILAAFLEKFQTEARTLAKLCDSRVVQVIQSGKNDDRFWIAMELVEGQTVDQRLSERGAFGERDAAQIGISVARALEFASRREIVHRDIKPGNIFLTTEGEVKVADWGLAKFVHAAPGHMTELHHVACTPTYASPEQAAGKDCTFSSDMYSLGVVLYEMLCEAPPFHADGPVELLFKHVYESPPEPRALNPEISEPMQNVLLRLLSKNPASRYSSYEELMEALARVRTPPVAPPRKKSALAITSVVVGIAAIAFSFVVLTWNSFHEEELPVVGVEEAREGVPVLPPAMPEVPRTEVPLPLSEESSPLPPFPEGAERRLYIQMRKSPVLELSKELTIEQYYRKYEMSDQDRREMHLLFRGVAPEKSELAHETARAMREGLPPVPPDELFGYVDPETRSYDPDWLRHVPGILYSTGERAIRSLEAGEMEDAKSWIAKVEKNRHLLPDAFLELLPMMPPVREELSSAEEFHAGNDVRVLKDFNRSLFAARSAKRILKQFRAQKLREVMSPSQWQLWEGEKQREKVQGRWVPIVTSRLSRSLKGAESGFEIQLSFSPEALAANSGWGVAFSHPGKNEFLQIEARREEVSLLRAGGQKGGDVREMDQKRVSLLSGKKKLTIFPRSGRVFVFVDDVLLFQWSEKNAPLAGEIHLAAHRGKLFLFSVQVPQSVSRR